MARSLRSLRLANVFPSLAVVAVSQIRTLEKSPLSMSVCLSICLTLVILCSVIFYLLIFVVIGDQPRWALFFSGSPSLGIILLLVNLCYVVLHSWLNKLLDWLQTKQSRRQEWRQLSVYYFLRGLNGLFTMFIRHINREHRITHYTEDKFNSLKDNIKIIDFIVRLCHRYIICLFFSVYLLSTVLLNKD